MRRLLSTLLVLTTQAGAAAGQFVFTVLSTRWLVPDERGSLILLLSVGNMAAMLLAGGLSVYGRRQLNSDSSKAFGTYKRAVMIASGAAALVASVAGIPILVALSGSRSIITLAALPIFTCAHVIQFLAMQAFYGTGKYRSAVWITLGYSAVQITGISTLQFFDILSLETAIVAYTLATIGLASVLVWRLTSETGTPERSTFRQALRMYNASWSSTPGALSQSFLQSVERVLVGTFAGSAGVAMFVAGISLQTPAQMLQMAAAQVTMTDATRGAKAPIRSNMPMFSVVVVVAIAGATFAPGIVPLLYGEGYSNAVPIAQVAMLTLVVLFLNGVLSAHHQGRGSIRRVNIVTGISVLSTLILLPGLTIAFGPLGAAFSLLATASLVLVGWTLPTAMFKK